MPITKPGCPCREPMIFRKTGAVEAGVNVGSRSSPPGREALMDDPSVRIIIAQVTTESAQNAKPIDPCIWTEVSHAFIPTLHHLAGDRLPRLEFADQEAIQVKQYFLT